MNWLQYHSHARISAWLACLAAAHPDTTQLINIGRSTEGRELQVYIVFIYTLHTV